MKQTAVEIFFEDLVHLGYIEYPDEKLVQDRLKLAKELEKHQIMEAYRDGRTDQQTKDGFYNRNSETYYNETYKKP
jgi:hypothetical protein